MTAFTNIPKQVEEILEKWDTSTSRRNFLKGSGLFVVSFSAAAVTGGIPFGTDANAAAPALAQAAGPYPDPDYKQLDSWIVIHQNGAATFFVGKTDGGQGTGTAFRQMMSDELDIAFDKTNLIMEAPISPWTRADRAAPTRSRPMAGPCAGWRPRPGGSCWNRRRRGSECLSINSQSTRA